MSYEPLLDAVYTRQSGTYRAVTHTTHHPPIESTDENMNGEVPVQKNYASIRDFFIICNLACISLINCVVTGMLLVGLPGIARELSIPDHLLLW